MSGQRRAGRLVETIALAWFLLWLVLWLAKWSKAGWAWYVA